MVIQPGGQAAELLSPPQIQHGRIALGRDPVLGDQAEVQPVEPTHFLILAHQNVQAAVHQAHPLDGKPGGRLRYNAQIGLQKAHLPPVDPVRQRSAARHPAVAGHTAQRRNRIHRRQVGHGVAGSLQFGGSCPGEQPGHLHPHSTAGVALVLCHAFQPQGGRLAGLVVGHHLAEGHTLWAARAAHGVVIQLHAVVDSAQPLCVLHIQVDHRAVAVVGGGKHLHAQALVGAGFVHRLELAGRILAQAAHLAEQPRGSRRRAHAQRQHQAGRGGQCHRTARPAPRFG